MFIPFREKFDKIFRGEIQWYKKYAWFLLFFVFIFIGVAFLVREEGLELRPGKRVSLIGFFFFFTTPLFIFMQTGEWGKRINNVFLKLLVTCSQIYAVILWLLVTCVWIMYLLNVD